MTTLAEEAERATFEQRYQDTVAENIQLHARLNASFAIARVVVDGAEADFCKNGPGPTGGYAKRVEKARELLALVFTPWDGDWLELRDAAVTAPLRVELEQTLKVIADLSAATKQAEAELAAEQQMTEALEAELRQTRMAHAATATERERLREALIEANATACAELCDGEELVHNKECRAAQAAIAATPEGA